MRITFFLSSKMAYFKGTTQIGGGGYFSDPTPSGGATSVIPWYLNPWIVGGGVLGVLLLVLIIYFVMRKPVSAEY